MGYTNKTTHYELPQYVATDKPKYLTDFNETMVAIDTQMYANAQAAATADDKAVAAKDVADGAVSSIGTLNTQINGNPEDPTDTGLAGAVSNNSTDIHTVQSLIGDGHPTTSNQTIIGAINGLEAAVAPREDGTDLANDYDPGEQFARGGSVYEALGSLTAGTPFAQLTLNTDYKVADTLVEQIAGASAEASEAAADVASLTSKIGTYQVLGPTAFTAIYDGTKTFGQLIDECISAINDYVDADSSRALFITNVGIAGISGAVVIKGGAFMDSATTDFGCDGQSITVGSSDATIYRFVVRTSGSNIQKVTMGASSNTFNNTYGNTVADHNVFVQALELKKIS